jgi:DNA-binding NtrC family response regulator
MECYVPSGSEKVADTALLLFAMDAIPTKPSMEGVVITTAEAQESILTRAGDTQPVRVLLVTPNPRVRTQMREKIGMPRWSLTEASSGAQALEMLAAGSIEVMLLDPVLPDIVVNEFHAMVLQQFPRIEILTLSAQTGHLLVASASPTTLANQLTSLIYMPGLHAPGGQGAHPMSVRTGLGDGLGHDLGNDGSEQTYAERGTAARKGLRGMVGSSPAMQHVYRLTEMVARTETTVLITGESGTGKDLVAQALHMMSPRAKHPFAVVNCAAIPEALLEAELFGYAKGAFTGAMQSRIGRIHAAHGGTLFLDEIGDMPLSLQSKILRFLEQGEVQRLGANDNLKVDVRVVAATNANLRELSKQKLFREDLYYRLAVFPVQLPPLRERDGDLVSLTQAFATKFCPGVRIAAETFAYLETHTWPGNVRELRNTIERAAILLDGERELCRKHILL